MKYKIISTGRNCEQWLTRCFDSIRSQSYADYEVCVVDDASQYNGGEIVRDYCTNMGWAYMLNTEQKGAMYNQVHAIRELAPGPDDVIVIVDSDDYLAHPDVLDHLNEYYADGTMMTYGSYRSEPYSKTCNPAMPYPPGVVKKRDFRRAAASGEGILFNHLRTFKHALFEGLDDSDFTWPDGTWFQSCCDAAIMIPCLELAGPKYKFISEVLYVYNSENPYSDWRRHPRGVDATHDYILTVLPPKVPVGA